MKKILLLGSFIFCTIAIMAQPGTFSLNLDAGYTFQSTVDFDAAYTEVQGAFRYGGGIEYFADFNKSVVLKYHRMDTDFPLYLDNGVQLNSDRDSKGSVNYILIGGNNYFGDALDAKALPYGGLGLGVGIIGVNGNTVSKFAWDARLGVKIKTSSVVSLKVEAYMQSIISTFGSDVWVYNGYAYAVPDYATLWQFGFTGIVCFDFKK